MIVRWPWKLAHYHGFDAPQLFNLVEDPGEARDLGNDVACAAIRRELHDRVLAGWSAERILDGQREEAESRRAIAEWARAVRPPEPDHWVEPEGCNIFPEA
jgi:hypothetical protein